MKFIMVVDVLVTMWTDLDALCKRLNKDPKFPEQDCIIEAKNVKNALVILKERLLNWGKSIFLKEDFGDDNVSAHFTLLDEKKKAVVKGSLGLVWGNGELTIHKWHKKRHRKSRAT